MAVLVFIGVSLLVAGGFWYYLSLGNGNSMGLADETPETVEEEAQTVEEPEEFSIQDAVDDLEGRGVTVVAVARVEGYSGDFGFLVEFSEFVKAAVEEEMVLMICPEGEAGVLLVPFENAEALAKEVNALLDHEQERHAMRIHAYEFARDMTWEKVASQYVQVARESTRERSSQPRPSAAIVPMETIESMPEPDLRHLRQMTDDTGVLQHAI